MADATATMLADRTVLRVDGEDVGGFLQGLVTHDLASVAPESPRWGGLLTPQGKALFDFLLWADDDAILIDCESSQAPALKQRLEIYRLRRRITIEPTAIAVHWSRDTTVGVPDPRLAVLGRRWLDSPGAPAKGWREHRLHLGVTEGVGELGSGETLWLEANAHELNGVSFTKGCYIGQENTARMHHRSKVNRRLVAAPIATATARTRALYPEYGLMIELRRSEALGDAIIPSWLAGALGAAST